MTAMPDTTFVKDKVKSVSYSFYYNVEHGLYLIIETTVLHGDPRPVVVAHELNTLQSVIEFREKNFFWRKGDGFKEMN
jgi:hypothetical protein